MRLAKAAALVLAYFSAFSAVASAGRLPVSSYAQYINYIATYCDNGEAGYQASAEVLQMPLSSTFYTYQQERNMLALNFANQPCIEQALPSGHLWPNGDGQASSVWLCKDGNLYTSEQDAKNLHLNPFFNAAQWTTSSRVLVPVGLQDRKLLEQFNGDANIKSALPGFQATVIYALTIDVTDSKGNVAKFQWVIASDYERSVFYTRSPFETKANLLYDFGEDAVFIVSHTGFAFVCPAGSGETPPPSSAPAHQPSQAPAGQPSNAPGSQPSQAPASQPSKAPGSQPSQAPASQPSKAPGSQPSQAPASQPSKAPGSQPSQAPASQPSNAPGTQPSQAPASQPSKAPGTQPSQAPASRPSNAPGNQPSQSPSSQPSNASGNQPSQSPSSQQSSTPSTAPTSAPVSYAVTYVVINTQTGGVIQELQNGNTLTSTGDFTIGIEFADSAAQASVQSVKFSLVGNAAVKNIGSSAGVVTEDTAPFIASGNSHTPLGITNSGSFTLTTSLYSGLDGTGTLLATDSLQFTADITQSPNASVDSFGAITNAKTAGWIVSGILVAALIAAELLLSPFLFKMNNQEYSKRYGITARPTVDMIKYVQFFVALLLVKGTFPTWFTSFASSWMWVLGIIKIQGFIDLAQNLVASDTCSSIAAQTSQSNSFFQALSTLGIPLCSVFLVVLFVFISVVVIAAVVFLISWIVIKFTSVIDPVSFRTYIARSYEIIWKVFYFPLALTALLQLNLPVHSWKMDLVAGFTLGIVIGSLSLLGVFSILRYVQLDHEGQRRQVRYLGSFFEEYRKPSHRLFFSVVFLKEIAEAAFLGLIWRNEGWQVGLLLAVLGISLLILIVRRPHLDGAERVMVSLLLIVEFVQTCLVIAMGVTHASTGAKDACAIVSMVLTGIVLAIFVLLMCRKIVIVLCGKHRDYEEQENLDDMQLQLNEPVAASENSDLEGSVPQGFYERNKLVDQIYRADDIQQAS